MMPFTFRHFEPETDLYRLVRLYTTVEANDHDGKDTGETRLREMLALPGHDPSQDSWVVEASDEADGLIAFAGVWKAPERTQADIAGLVGPTYRRRSIGRELMRRILVRARALGATQVNVYVESRNQASIAFLSEHRFQPVGAFTLLRAPATIPVDSPAWPPGFRVRTYEDAHQLPQLTAAMNSCYDDLWGHSPVTEEQVAHWLADWPADGIFLLFDAGGEVAGICRTEVSRQLSAQRGEPTGYIDAPGVVPWRRLQGLYLPLLVTALDYLRAKQPAAIELESWGDDDQNLALYQVAGFDIARQSILYRLNLR
jgi:ribosomal protein S18 acetylase RimI-like enzyme